MNFLLQRFSDNGKSTLGLLLKIIAYGQGFKTSFQAYTLEDEYRDEKVMAETRIPAGKYEIVIQKQDTPLTKKYRSKYPWFKSHLMVNNVPGFTGVYLHIGNTDADSAGCILLGDNADNNVIGLGSIANSTASFKRFYEPVYEHMEKGGKVFLTVKDEKELM